MAVPILLSDIIAQRQRFTDSDFPSSLASTIAACPKFEMDHDFLKVAMDVSVVDPKSVLRALPNAKSPYPKFWIEYDFAEFLRICFGERAGRISGTQGARKGALIEISEKDSNNLLINFVQFDSGKLHHLVFEGKLNIAGQFAIPECPRSLFPFIDLVQDAALLGWCAPFGPEFQNASFRRDNEEAMKTLINNFSLCCSRFQRRLWFDAAHQAEETRYVPDKLPEEIRITCGHLGLESRLLTAALCLLNSKNLCKITTSPSHKPDSTVKTADYRGDKYHVLSINLNRAQGNRAVANGTEALIQIRKHQVRGHFKVRKTGIYWWSAFERGNADIGYVYKDYLLQNK